MRILNPDLLADFRGPACEWCKLSRPTDAAHLFSRGAGHLDIRANLIGLCRECHCGSHSGTPTKADLMAIVAAREKCLQADIQDVVWFLRRMPRWADRDYVKAQAVRQLKSTARVLLWRQELKLEAS